MADHDELLRKHREKFESHKLWMEQQQQLLRECNVGSPSPVAQVAPPGFGGYDADAAATTAGGTRGAHGSSWGHGQHQHGATTPGSRRAASGASAGGGGVFSPYRYNAPYVPGSPLTVHTRATQWVKRREQKLEELRRESLANADVACPFRPDVASSRGGSSERGGSAARDRAPPPPGFEDFLRRQAAARELKAEQARRGQCSGAGWKNEVTVPEEFDLGRRPYDQIEALKKPIRAPVVSAADALCVDEVRRRAGPVDFFASANVPRGTFSSLTSTSIIDHSVGGGHRSPRS